MNESGRLIADRPVELPWQPRPWPLRDGRRDEPSVSVVILNRDRPHLLARVLAGLGQLRYRNFEVVVVGDRATVGALGLDPGLAARLRYDHCPDPNISRARNIALGIALGEIVAFCDDDAVPEPDWLCRLVEPFADPWVGAAGGIVRGRDGICIQCGGAMFDRTAEQHKLHDLGPEQPMRIFPPQPDWQVGFMGVNSAFRRTAITQIGGFDESYHYFLDETDALMRLGRAGWSVALVPRAEIHHLEVENASRGRLRKPKDLYQIAASKAYFCARHAPDLAERALAQFRARRLADLDRFIHLGLMSPAERAHLEERLDLGLAAGRARIPMTPLTSDPAPGGGMFRPFRDPEARRVRQLTLAVVTGWGVGATAAAGRLARGLAAQGQAVSCLDYALGRARAQVTFRDGLWLHRGGTWRLARDRTGAWMIHRARRAREEIARIQPRRQFDLVLRPTAARYALAGPPVAVLRCAALGLTLAVDALAPTAVSGALMARLAQAAAQALDAPVEVAGPGGQSWRGVPVPPETARGGVPAAPETSRGGVPLRASDAGPGPNVSTIQA